MALQMARLADGIGQRDRQANLVDQIDQLWVDWQQVGMVPVSERAELTVRFRRHVPSQSPWYLHDLGAQGESSCEEPQSAELD
jgi:hypothetical protein